MGHSDEYKRGVPPAATHGPAGQGLVTRHRVGQEEGAGLLRVRLGDDVAVSADKGRIFLYAGTEKAADEAGQVARDTLVLGGQVAQSSLLERWDPNGQKWRDPRVEVTEDDQPPGQRSGGASWSTASSRS